MNLTSLRGATSSADGGSAVGWKNGLLYISAAITLRWLVSGFSIDMDCFNEPKSNLLIECWESTDSNSSGSKKLLMLKTSGSMVDNEDSIFGGEVIGLFNSSLEALTSNFIFSTTFST